jgi:hypothetical protein
MPNQVDGAFLHAPCPVPSCPACEPNSGSVLSSVSAKSCSSRGADIVMQSSVTEPTLSRMVRELTFAAAVEECAEIERDVPYRNRIHDRGFVLTEPFKQSAKIRLVSAPASALKSAAY